MKSKDYGLKLREECIKASPLSVAISYSDRWSCSREIGFSVFHLLLYLLKRDPKKFTQDANTQMPIMSKY